MAAVSFACTKSSNPTDQDISDLYYVVEYLRVAQDMSHILHASTISALRLYCEVDESSYLLHPDSKGHTGYTISFYGASGTFHNRSVKQTAVATSSTHAEARALFTLAKELNLDRSMPRATDTPRATSHHHVGQRCSGEYGQQ